jgi:hypothetical protein
MNRATLAFGAMVFAIGLLAVNPSTLGRGGGNAGGPITVQQHDRSIGSWIWIGGCPSQTQNASASDLEPFDATVGVEPACPQGQGAANASQYSEILSNGFSAQGTGQYSIGSSQNAVIHASATSRFDVTFLIDQPKRFRLTGLISASRQGNVNAPGTVAYTTVRLSTGSSTSGDKFARTIQPPMNQPVQEQVSSIGALEKGTYRIFAFANMFADQAFNNVWVDAAAGFDLDLVVAKPADVTFDGVVNVDDLFVVILGWGACPLPCPSNCAADITSDCAVNVDDLFAVIANWG